MSTVGPPAAVGHLVRAPKTAELVAAHVRRQIVRGDLAAGDTLPPETDLMRQFGVSRPTLREAFRILETESLLRVRRGARGGAQVTGPDIAVAARYVGLILQMQGATIGDVYEARIALEPTCARLFALDGTQADLADLHAAIDELQRLVDAPTSDPVQWSVASYRVHEVVVQGSRNRTLAVQGGILQEIAATHIAATVSRTFERSAFAERFSRLVRSYRRLADLIAAQDGPGAEAHWRAQMEAAARSFADDVRFQAVVDLFGEPIPGVR